MLVDHEIRKAIENGDISIDPYDPTRIQPASYDVLLGDHFQRLATNQTIDPREPPKMLDWTTDVFLLPRHGFALARTVETFKFAADIVGIVNGKSSLARLGLQVHATAGFVDPGFEGTLTLELTNMTSQPMRLHAGMKIAQVVFVRTATPCEQPYGTPGLGSKYQHQQDATPSKYHLND